MKTKNIYFARSNENGIIFYSNTFSGIGLETFRDNLGSIQSRFTYMPIDHYMNGFGNFDEKERLFNKLLVIIFDLILLSICIFLRNFWLIFASIYFSIFVSFKLFKFIQISYQMKSKNGKKRSTSKFHAAEHKVINAYEKFQRLPTFDEIKQSSSFSKKCGSRKIIYPIIQDLLISLNIAIYGHLNFFVYLSLILLICLFVKIANYKGWLDFLQVFFTNIPSDSEIEVALEGIKNFEKMEESFNTADNISIMIHVPQGFPFMFC